MNTKSLKTKQPLIFIYSYFIKKNQREVLYVKPVALISKELRRKIE